jgi:hypothetical protein
MRHKALKTFEFLILLAGIALICYLVRPNPIKEPDVLDGVRFRSLQFSQGEFRSYCSDCTSAFVSDRGRYEIQGDTVSLQSDNPGPPKKYRLAGTPGKLKIKQLSESPNQAWEDQWDSPVWIRPGRWKGERLSLNGIVPGQTLSELRTRGNWRPGEGASLRPTWHGVSTTEMWCAEVRGGQYFVEQRLVIAADSVLAVKSKDGEQIIFNSDTTVCDVIDYFQEKPEWTHKGDFWTAKFSRGLKVSVNWETHDRDFKAPTAESNCRCTFELELP